MAREDGLPRTESPPDPNRLEPFCQSCLAFPIGTEIMIGHICGRVTYVLPDSHNVSGPMVIRPDSSRGFGVWLPPTRLVSNSIADRIGTTRPVYSPSGAGSSGPNTGN